MVGDGGGVEARFEEPGQEFDRDQQRERWPAGDCAADEVAATDGDVGRDAG